MSVNAEKPRDAAFAQVVRDAIELFRKKEREYLLTYTDADCDESDPPWVNAAHLCYYGELLFVLKGVKPCVLFCHYYDPVHVRTMVERCLQPVLAQFDLLSYGFHLEQIRHPMPTTSTVHDGFQNGWILADKHSARWDLVQKVFLKPFPLPKVPEALVGEALGYPTLDGPHKIRYIDETEMDYMQQNHSEECCCVNALEFFCANDPRHFLKLLRHYGVYQDAMQAAGRRLAIDTSKHQPLEEWIAAMNAMRAS
ncbi:hypothetical protein BDZ89DRAFT_653153 [Hymenopellis radicata]|nr:hypothetical protein BDZ89DRAFT_653153 [Hymenopellis radicata]